MPIFGVESEVEFILEFGVRLVGEWFGDSKIGEKVQDEAHSWVSSHFGVEFVLVILGPGVAIIRVAKWMSVNRSKNLKHQK